MACGVFTSFAGVRQVLVGLALAFPNKDLGSIPNTIAPFGLAGLPAKSKSRIHSWLAHEKEKNIKKHDQT